MVLPWKWVFNSNNSNSAWRNGCMTVVCNESCSYKRQQFHIGNNLRSLINASG